jgi:hypothetical protein
LIVCFILFPLAKFVNPPIYKKQTKVFNVCMVPRKENDMTKEEGREYTLRVLLDAVSVLGSKAALAREFDLKPAAISQWVKRRRFPVRLAYRMSKIVGKKLSPQMITKALLVQAKCWSWSDDTESEKVS